MANETAVLIDRTPPETEASRGLPDSYRAAWLHLRSRNFLKTARYRSQQWKAERRGADPKLEAFEKAFIAKAAELEIPLYAPLVVRSEATQQRLYVMGKEPTESSPHTEGVAIQIVHGQFGTNLPGICWDLIEHIGREAAASVGARVDHPRDDLWIITNPDGLTEAETLSFKGFSEKVYGLDQDATGRALKS